MINYIIIAVIALLMGAAIRYQLKLKKRGGGCDCNCPGCTKGSCASLNHKH